VAKPSKPSVKLTALEEPTITKIEKGIKNQPKLITKFLKNGKYRLVVRSESIKLYKINNEIKLSIICIINFN